MGWSPAAVTLTGRHLIGRSACERFVAPVLELPSGGSLRGMRRSDYACWGQTVKGKDENVLLFK